MGYTTEKVVFTGHNGHQMSARLENPDGEIFGYALFAHCFTCSKDIHAATRISRALTKNGIAVLRFDFTGLGNSDGDFSNTNFTTNVEDLVCAYNFMSQHHGAPEVLIGHSLGGAAVLAAKSYMPAVKLISTIGAPGDVVHLEKLLGSNISEIENTGQSEVNLGGRKFVIKKQFLDDIRSISLEEKIEGLGASLLIFHSPIDSVVSIENAHSIFEKANYPKSMICLDGASHLLDRLEDSEFVANIISTWSMRYLMDESRVAKKS